MTKRAETKPTMAVTIKGVDQELWHEFRRRILGRETVADAINRILRDYMSKEA